ncbi:MAG: exonuclease SbcCD subunit D [Nanoarchaeota archaeon]|nr:exonuclease SbcCD subunit D [Nanoarchaeota archaeon]
MDVRELSGTMVKFSHISDCHLGGWKQPELQELNLQSFKKAIETCIKEKVEFILISGDLFDSAYPPIDILKETFSELKKLHDSKIPCFIIAGSHDYSVSGKTFLDVLEKAGFCVNVTNFEEKGDLILLNPIIYKNIAIYGYPGKKSSLEINDLRRIRLQESPGLFHILMLHTTIDKAKGTIPVDSIETELLPQADYYALGHMHLDFQYEKFVYPGPTFPNNFQELEDLKYGSFYIVDTEEIQSLKRIDLKIKEVESIHVKVNSALTATDQIISEIKKRDIKDKIVLLRIKGNLENGTPSDIKFTQIEEIIIQKGAYFYLKNTHELKTKEVEFNIQAKDTENIEEEAIKIYLEDNPSKFNELIPSLIHSLSLDKQEDEKIAIFENRLIDETKRVLKF